MKWRGGERRGAIDDRRGVRKYVFETAYTKPDRQFERVRESRYQKSVKRDPYDIRGAIQRANPEGADMPSSTRKRVEQLVAWKETIKPPPARPPRGRTRYTKTRR